MELIRPLDVSDPEGEKISLHLRVLPARAAEPAPDPVYVLVGGPGQAASEVGPSLAPVLNKLRAERDIVLLDQRGTGSSSPLDCGEELRTVAELFDTDFKLDEFRECLEGYPVDPSLFTTEAAVADLEALREELGHAQVNLFGLSYGTRLALAYQRRHADKVRSAVLDGVAPPNIALPRAMDVGSQGALEGTISDCANSPACAAAYPNLARDFDLWTSELSTAALPFEVMHPRSGARQKFQLSKPAALGALRSALYTSESAALIPLAITEASQGRVEPLVGLASMVSGSADTISSGLFMSIICAEDMRQEQKIDRGEAEVFAAEPSARGDLFGGQAFAQLKLACALWPQGAVPEDFAEPVRSEVPTLLLSGARDPATPAAWAAEAAQHLPKSRHVIAPGVGHGTWSRGCVADLIEQTIVSGTTSGLDVGCVESLRRPAFFVGPQGPAMQPPKSASLEASP